MMTLPPPSPPSATELEGAKTRLKGPGWTTGCSDARCSFGREEIWRAASVAVVAAMPAAGPQSPGSTPMMMMRPSTTTCGAAASKSRRVVPAPTRGPSETATFDAAAVMAAIRRRRCPPTRAYRPLVGPSAPEEKPRPSTPSPWSWVWKAMPSVGGCCRGGRSRPNPKRAMSHRSAHSPHAAAFPALLVAAAAAGPCSLR